MFLNIIEPPRSQLGAVSITNHVNSKCCNCCYDYGVVSLTLKSDKNFVLNGDTIHIGGTVDNTRGNDTITNCMIMLEERICIATSANTK